MGEASLLIGVDEVGRGCIAGPVCAAAYAWLDASLFACSDVLCVSPTLLKSHTKLFYLDDSKKVSHKRRESLCSALKNLPNAHWSANFEPANEIDEKGIVHCIWAAMSKSVQDVITSIAHNHSRAGGNLTFNKIVVLVDGPKPIKNLGKNLFDDLDECGIKNHNFIVEQIPIVKGDGKSALIAAASNIAKLTRDKYMKNLAEDFPHYSWHTNVGYGTRKHMEAIGEVGTCELHRRSFL